MCSPIAPLRAPQLCVSVLRMLAGRLSSRVTTSTAFRSRQAALLSRPNVKAMATSKNGQKLDKNTPEEVWKTILSAEEVGASRAEGFGPAARSASPLQARGIAELVTGQCVGGEVTGSGTEEA